MTTISKSVSHAAVSQAHTVLKWLPEVAELTERLGYTLLIAPLRFLPYRDLDPFTFALKGYNPKFGSDSFIGQRGAKSLCSRFEFRGATWVNMDYHSRT